MARIRTIKPGHWSDKELTKLPLAAHLFWIGTWNFSDDEGVFEADPLLLKSQVFPRRTDIRTEQVEQWIDQLVTARFIIPFQHEEIGYYIHRTFKTHQKIDKPQPSKIPSEIIRRILGDHSPNVRGAFAPDRIGEEGKGKERGADKPPTPSNSSFEIFIPPEREVVRKFFASSAGDPKNPKCWPADKCRLEADQFFDHYKANGWVQGKDKKIVDWESAAFKWIRNEQKGTFETGNTQAKSKLPLPVEKKQGFSTSEKIAKDLRILYQKYLVDQCTIISIETQYYGFLKGLNMMEFDDFAIQEIRENAEKIIIEKGLQKSEQNLAIFMKKLGVLECFRRLKAAGKKNIFGIEIGKVA